MKGIKAIYDNGGETIDRYTVYYSNPKDWGITRPGIYPCVGMNAAPFHPQGFGQHGEGMLGRHNGKRIPFESLPEDCRKLIEMDLKED
jgi:hypothetical protein